MLGCIILAALIAFGVGVVRRLGLALTRLETIGLVGAVALTLGPWVLFLAAWGLGFRIGLPVACAAMLVGGWWLARGRAWQVAADLGTSGWSWLVLAGGFGLLFSGHMLHAERGGLYTGGVTYGDLALHATLARHFAVTEVSFASPLVANQSLTYPFLGDFLVGCLMRGGWSASSAFALTGLASALLGLALLEAVAVRLFRSRVAGVLAVWLVVLSGSAVGIAYAVRDVARAGLPDKLGALPDYSHLRGHELVWGNLVTNFLLPQRALLAALPGCWAVVLLLARAERRAHVVAAIVLGALPMFHVHSFLVGVGLCAWLASWRTVARLDGRRTLWLAVAIAGALAAPQLAWQFGQSFGHGFGRWRRGWMAPRGEFASFWLRNWGLALVLAPAGAVIAARRDRGFALPMYLAGVGLFAAVNLYQFQPHDWDNTKFLVYAYMFIAIVIAGGLAQWWTHGGARRVASAVAVLALTSTGAIAVVREAGRHDQLATAADVARAAALREVLPPDARVLTSDRHNHLVPMLTGRAIVMGYRGWLWTYGIDVRGLVRDVRIMFAAEPGFERALRRRGVTHVYIGPAEREDFHADAARYRARFQTVFVDGDVEVFDVRSRARKVARTQ